MPTRLLVVGSDKIGRGLLARVGGIPDLAVAVDVSTDLGRVFALLRRGKLRVRWLLKMALAEFTRPAPAPHAAASIRGNADLQAFIDAGVRRIYLFRAGLIVNQTVLASKAEILNVHCAALPAYGGVGAIPRALCDGAYAQVATLHRVTERIDGGEVVDTASYTLEPSRSYRANEDLAYATGAALLLKHLRPA